MFVSKPIINDGIKKFVSYTLGGSAIGQEVSRRFSDFYSLREKLIERWPGVYIPNVPPKKAVGNTDSKIIDKRIRLLNRFCYQLSTVNFLFESEEVKLFQSNGNEIAKAISKNCRLLILDEPTASLNESDSQKLLELIDKFRSEGMTSIIISHKLNEISYIANSITVVRDGSTIETLDNNDHNVSEDRIIAGMVGRALTDRFPKRKPEHKISDEILLEVNNWNVSHPLNPDRKVNDNVSIKIHRGEVVGFAGLMGAGRTEFAKSLFGHSYGTKIHGEVKINGKVVHLNNVRQAIEAGLAYVTEDRKGDGLVLENPISTNMTLANLDAVSDHMVIDKDLELAKAKELKQDLNVKCASVLQNVGNLSGGNQQKVLLAKWMFAEPDVLILDEPTRGIDVGAKYEIYCLINKLVEAGKAVLMISSELPEVLGMSDRIYVMNEGKIVGEMPRSEASQESIMSAILRTSGKKKSVEQ